MQRMRQVTYGSVKTAFRVTPMNAYLLARNVQPKNQAATVLIAWEGLLDKHQRHFY